MLLSALTHLEPIITWLKLYIIYIKQEQLNYFHGSWATPSGEEGNKKRLKFEATKSFLLCQSAVSEVKNEPSNPNEMVLLRHGMCFIVTLRVSFWIYMSFTMNSTVSVCLCSLEMKKQDICFLKPQRFETGCEYFIFENDFTSKKVNEIHHG